MRITLTPEELEHAIACYLRANAAVEVGEITFSLKKTGIETVVETTIKEFQPTEIEPLDEDIEFEAVPEEEELESIEPEVFEEQVPTEEFESNQEELIDAEVLTSVEEETPSPQLDFNFDNLAPETVEEMPVTNSISIADILGVN